MVVIVCLPGSHNIAVVELLSPLYGTTHYSRLPTPRLHCASAKDGRALKIVDDIGQYWQINTQPVSFSAVRKDIVEVVK